MTKTLDIRVEPFPGERGRKVVIVAGEQWATIHMHGHGSHGTTYSFAQLFPDGESSGITQPNSSRDFKVDGDRLAERRRRLTDPPLPSLDERLLAAAHTLISDCRLRSPAAAAADAEAELQAWRDEQAAELAAIERKIANKADELLAFIATGEIAPIAPATLRRELIEALTWARNPQ